MNNIFKKKNKEEKNSLCKSMVKKIKRKNKICILSIIYTYKKVGLESLKNNNNKGPL